MEDNQFHWKQVQVIRESQEGLLSGERDIRYMPETAKTVYPKETAVEMRFACDSPGEARIYIYAARKNDGIVDVADGVITTGRQTVTRKDKRLYCVDDMTIRNKWLSNHALALCPGGWSRIMFGTHGYHRFFVRLNFRTGTWYVDMVGADK